MESAVTWGQVALVLGIGFVLVVVVGVLLAILSAYADGFKH